MVKLKHIGISFFAVLCLIFLATSANAAEITLNPITGAVGSPIVISGTNFTNSSSVNITFDGAVLMNNVTVTNNSFSTSTTVPEHVAEEITIVTTGDGESATADFVVINTAPTIIPTTISNAWIKQTYTEDIEISDANGDYITCTSISGGPTTRLQIDEYAANNKNYCRLTFDGTGMPTVDEVGDYTLILTINDGDVNTTKNFDFKILDYMDVTFDELDDITGDDSDHMPGDTIKLKIEVENLIDVSKLGLDTDELENIEITITNEELDIDESSAKFDLKDKGDHSTKTIEFMIPYDATEKTYTFTITATGEDDNTGPGSDAHKAITTTNIKVKRDAHSIIITDAIFENNVSSCGNKATLSFKLRNIGENDEENISLAITANGLNLESIFDSFDLNEDDSIKKEAIFTIPLNAYDTAYNFKIKVIYDEDYKSTTEYIELDVINCDSEFLDVSIADGTIYLGDKTTLNIALESISLSDDTFEVKLIGIDKFGTYNTSDDLTNVIVTTLTSEELSVELASNANATAGLYEIEVEIYKDDVLIGSKSIGLTLEKVGLLSGLAIFDGNVGQTSLTLGIVIVLALIIYLGYQLWIKRKEFFGYGSDYAKKGTDDDLSSLVFEEDKPKPKKRQKKTK